MSSTLPASPLRSSAHAGSDGPPLSDAARLFLARSRSYSSQQRDVPEAKRSRAAASSSSSWSRPRATLSRSSSSLHRPAAAPSGVDDWMVDSGLADLPPTPAQQSCPYVEVEGTPSAGAFSSSQRTSGSEPPEPSLRAHRERYTTPESSPEGPHEFPASGSSSAGLTRAATLPSRSSFVKRDDLTVKAVARAQSLSASAAAAVAGMQRPGDAAAAPSPEQPLQPGSDKDRFVSGLVGASVLAIESIWGPSSPASSASPAPSSMSGSSNPGVLPLQWFVKEVLRRSRTSCSTLQLALYYLHKSRRDIREAVAHADASRSEIVRLEQELKACKARASSPSYDSLSSSSAYPSPPRSPSDSLDAAHVLHASALASELSERFSQLVAAQNSPVLCGRRMFLAALISASKYLQDRNYSNRAWAKISGLTVGEINKNERAFLKVVQFQLHLRAEDFQRWTERLATLSPSPSPQSSPESLPLTALSRKGLSRSASEYAVVADVASAQLAAGVRAHGPLTVMARTALSRGQSAAAVLGHHAHLHGPSAPTATPSSDVRVRGFPIAQPMAYRQPAPAAGPGFSAVSSDVDAASSVSSSASAYSVAGSSTYSAVEPRKVRALPTRRTALPRTAAALVPSAWASGSAAASPRVAMDEVVHTGVAARRVDVISAH